MKLINKLKYDWYRYKWNNPKLFLGKYPLHVDIEVSSVCNAKCGFCPHSDEKVDFEKSYMSLNMFKDIIDEIEGNVPAIKLNLRGEPTLHREFIQMLDYVKGKFIDVRINTNGFLNHIPTINKIVDVCDNISISVNSYNNKSFCSEFGLKHTNFPHPKYVQQKKNINLFIELIEIKNLTIQKQDTKLTLSYVDNGTHGNKMIGEAVFMKKTLDKNIVNIFYRKAFDRTRPDVAITTDGHTSVTTTQIGRSRKDCLMPLKRLSIASNGDVYPCCVMWHKPFILLADFKKNTIWEIWNSDQIHDIRKELANIRWTEYSKHPACMNCGSSESYN